MTVVAAKCGLRTNGAEINEGNRRENNSLLLKVVAMMIILV